MISTSWGTKRNCPSCNVFFYDLNKNPAHCPKCSHQFEPATPVRAKRKSKRVEADVDTSKKHITILPMIKKDGKKDKKNMDVEDAGEDIVELEDDGDGLQELSELEEREEELVNEDDADDETLMDDLPTGEKALVGNVEEEEASALINELDEEKEAGKKNFKSKKKL